MFTTKAKMKLKVIFEKQNCSKHLQAFIWCQQGRDVLRSKPVSCGLNLNQRSPLKLKHLKIFKQLLDQRTLQHWNIELKVAAPLASFPTTGQILVLDCNVLYYNFHQ